jgi:inorganic pyrophosphatase
MPNINMKLPPPFVPNTDHIHAVIETPKGSRSKYAFDPDTGFFKLKKILPAGTAFPLDFGFIPGTKADDGDPVDVLILTEQNLEQGCLLECRIIGVIQAEQQDKGKEPERNDRIVAIPLVSHDYELIQKLEDMGQARLDDIIHFFDYYRAMSGGMFKAVGKKDAKTAIDWIKQRVV